MNRHLLGLLAGLALSSPALLAQPEQRTDELRASRPVITVRQLSSAVAGDSTALMGVGGVRHLPNGGVIVNDPTKRQLVLFDSSLTRFTVLADTSTNSPNSYGLRGYGGALVAYMGDSSLFVDSESQAFLVIDPEGRFARVMAPVRPNDLFYISSGFYGVAGFDPHGRLIYRGVRRTPSMFMGMEGTASTQVTVQPDSSPIVRVDFDKRTVDTIAMIKIPAQKSSMTRTQSTMVSTNWINPLPQTDEWALMPDGSIAIVRGQDYHIDWVAPDGKLTSSPRLPFDWKRITLEDKQQIVDSVKKAYAEFEARTPQPPPMAGQSMTFRSSMTVVDATELPDYYPAVRANQVRADLDGNVWILPATSVDARGGLLYDVVNRSGQLVERVQLPAGRTLVGFGPGATIYMARVRGANRAVLERATVMR